MLVDTSDRSVLLTGGALVLILAIPAAMWGIGGLDNTDEFRELEITSDGVTVASLSVQLAETTEEKRAGLSDHESLSKGSGMLFIHSGFGERTYGMPDMEFGIDIAFIDEECNITAIYSAEKPTDGESGFEPHHRYTDDGKYVLETSEGYLADRVSVGDEVSVGSVC